MKHSHIYAAALWADVIASNFYQSYPMHNLILFIIAAMSSLFLSMLENANGPN